MLELLKFTFEGVNNSESYIYDALIKFIHLIRENLRFDPDVLHFDPTASIFFFTLIQIGS